ncbi:MAG: hypothetical protein ACRDDY_16535 [Clostridium sp.]|uniref:hypothetical protein n=1 Tax=Clostridium sp. TaxID=1506 RepID=UPI003EE51F6D
MKSIDTCKHVAIAIDNEITYIAFDGENYFYTIKNKLEIIKVNEFFIVKKRYYTNKEYNVICYDWDEKCFFVASIFYEDRIFKLDLNMKEIDCIKINLNKKQVTGISYDCMNKKLIISLNNEVISLCKKSLEITRLYSTEKENIKGVLSVAPIIILTILSEECYKILVLTAEKKCIGKYSISKRGKIINLLSDPCMKKKILMFIKDRNNIFVCDCIEISQKVKCKMNRCNNKICEKKKEKDEKDVCSDVIESIALVEAAISHVLNAEGEKIQKVLAETDDISEILIVNKEVNKTIISLTHLEQILYEKLSRIIDSGLCCNKCEKK